MKKINVLLVDDSGFEQARIKSLLEGLGHQVHLASNGIEALEAFAVLRPDLVLLDVMMPVMDGLETARRLRALPLPWTPIVFISSSIEPEDIAAGINAGGDDYLSKPVNGVVLAAKLLAMQRISSMKSLIESFDGGAPLREQVAEAIEVDEATGLATQRAGCATLAREYSRCSRSSQPVSLMLVGIDRFAKIEREHGDEAALACLRQAVAALQSNASRMADFIWRQDESTLAVVMPDTPMTGALRVAERVRRTVCQLEQMTGDGTRNSFPLSVSIGVTTALPQKGRESGELLSAAQNMMALAMRDGGNRVETLVADMPFHLTAREMECLQWSAIGKSSKEIADILKVSESAVNFHMANVRSKFDVNSRRQAVAIAIRHGLIRGN